jgi:hypothetical protein
MPATQRVERQGLGPVLRAAGPAGPDDQQGEPARIGVAEWRRKVDVVAKLVLVHDRDEQIPVFCANLTVLDE